MALGAAKGEGLDKHGVPQFIFHQDSTLLATEGCLGGGEGNSDEHGALKVLFQEGSTFLQQRGVGGSL